MTFDEYERDLFAENVGVLSPDDIGKRNLVDLLDFILHFASYRKEREAAVLDAFPEIHNVYLDKSATIGMYTRFAKEALTVLRRYRYVKALLK